MTWIEGVGDEVVQVFVYFFLFLIGILAWWSTRITERPLVRTVLILERRGNRQIAAGEPPSSPTAETAQPQEDKPTETASVDESEASSVSSDASAPIPQVSTLLPEATDSSLELRESCSEDECMRDRHDSSGTQSNISQGDGDRPINYSLPRSETFLSDKKKSPTESAPSLPSTEAAKESHKSEDEQHNITIRLKYLNDDLKMVDGNLEEQLGEFKRRHFSLELSARKLVRLIFNGQVLGQDTWTLGHYGLFDNCVVHCLVHNPRTPPPSPNLNAREGSQRRSQLSAWAVSNVLLAGLSILLSLAWYGRYHYAHLYTATTTVALVGLTGLFTVSIIGIYMPEIMQN